MNHFTVPFLSLALLVAAAMPALADGDSNRATPQVEITATRSALNDPQIVNAVSNLDTIYELSNGRRLAVTSYGESLSTEETCTHRAWTATPAPAPTPLTPRGPWGYP